MANDQPSSIHNSIEGIMDFLHSKIIVWLLAVLLLTGCEGTLPRTTPAPANTAIASITPFPTVTPLPATPTPTPTSTASPTSMLAPSATIPPQTGSLAMIFVNETVPDGTNIKPGQKFQKSWTLKNGGTQPWTAKFALAVTASTPVGELLGSPNEILLGKEVQPGEDIPISVDLVAPQQDGRYTLYYELRDEIDQPVQDSQVWVMITVGAVPPSGSTTIGNISAQLLRTSMQAGEYSVSFCMQLPDNRAWYPWNVTLAVNQQSLSPTSSRIDPATALTANKCFTFNFPTNGNDIAGSVQLSIGKVELPPEVHQEENCAFAHSSLTAMYPGLDFTCAGPGLFYTNLVTPPGMSTEQANQLIMDAISSSVYGPWILNVQ